MQQRSSQKQKTYHERARQCRLLERWLSQRVATITMLATVCVS